MKSPRSVILLAILVSALAGYVAGGHETAPSEDRLASPPPEPLREEVSHLGRKILDLRAEREALKSQLVMLERGLPQRADDVFVVSDGQPPTIRLPNDTSTLALGYLAASKVLDVNGLSIEGAVVKAERVTFTLHRAGAVDGTITTLRGRLVAEGSVERPTSSPSR